MFFEIMGPLRVTRDDGTEVKLTRPRVRNLLTVLLLHANQAMTTGQLADAMYEDGRGLGGSALRTHVWWLRSALSSEQRMHTVPGGYRLDVRPGELDLDRFRDLARLGSGYLRSGDHRSAAELLDHASALWRGTQLPDLPPTIEMTQVHEALLDERRIAQEQLADARLALGDHRQILNALRARVNEDARDERACEQLLRALYRCGRKPEAFDAYARLRGVLADGYGANPSLALQRLYQQIIEEDPTLELPGAHLSTSGGIRTIAR